MINQEQEIIRAVINNDSVKLIDLIKDGNNINFISDEKGSPLLLAVLKGHYEIVDILLKNKVDIHIDNESALYGAIIKGHTNIVEKLIKHGADIHIYNDSALHAAAFHNRLEIVDLLIKNGADIHSLEDKAIINAVMNNHIEVVKLLMDNKANIHTLDDYSIKYAVSNGYNEIVKTLINDYDINISIETKKSFIKNKNSYVLDLIDKREYDKKLKLDDYFKLKNKINSQPLI